LFDQNLFNMVNGANLTAVLNVGALEHLRDGMSATARQLRLFIAGNHLQNFYAATLIIRCHTPGNRHLRKRQGFDGIVFEQLVNDLSRRHLPQTPEVFAGGKGLQVLICTAVRLRRLIVIGN
jgi:hypothetical protein